MDKRFLSEVKQIVKDRVKNMPKSEKVYTKTCECGMGIVTHDKSRLKEFERLHIHKKTFIQKLKAVIHI